MAQQNKLNSISQQIKQEIANAVLGVFDGVSLDLEHVSLEHPSAEEHGDYSTNVALQLSKELGLKPRVVAERILKVLQQNVSETISKDIKSWDTVEIAGPGFINFWLSPSQLLTELKEITTRGETYGSSKAAAAIGKWDKVIVEYSSPNIAKPFGIGHLRSTIIGDSVQRILKFQGYNVLTDNHLGDWGTQFGKLCYAIKTWGNEESIWQSTEPIKTLVRLYVQFHKEAKVEEETKGTTTILDAGRDWFSRLEKGDFEAKRLWKLCIDASMKEFKEIYDLLGVSFDLYLGESFFENRLAGIIELAKKSHYAKENEGALLIFYPDDELSPMMIRKSDGSTLYSTRDLATDQYRIEKWGKNTFIINETGSEQGFYWRQLYKADELLGICAENQRFALLHGLMLSPDGKKFSTRKGDELWLMDVLNEAISKAAKVMKERKIGLDLPRKENEAIAKAVAVGALKYNDLKQGHLRDIVFDWEKVINFEGDSGPYLQYTYARAQSVLRKVMKGDLIIGHEYNTFVIQELAILRWLYRFPEVVELSAKTYSPNLLATYLFELAKRFNAFYAETQIIGSNEESFRLSLTAATSVIIKNGLNLLGIEALERM